VGALGSGSLNANQDPEGDIERRISIMWRGGWDESNDRQGREHTFHFNSRQRRGLSKAETARFAPSR
jgi:hypothetical protein